MARILILEDEEQSRNALIKILQNISDQVTVDAAADLATARLLLDGTVSFDLFLLDINLCLADSEDQSGLLFAEEIRARRQYEFTPLVMITSIHILQGDFKGRMHLYEKGTNGSSLSDHTAAFGKITEKHILSMSSNVRC